MGLALRPKIGMCMHVRSEVHVEQETRERVSWRVQEKPGDAGGGVGAVHGAGAAAQHRHVCVGLE